jgi:alkylhydroperoxidase family enzyme
MARVTMMSYEAAPPESKKLWDKQVHDHGRMTNMKKTLAHSAPALGALMEWYPLRDDVEKFLGARATSIYVHAISAQTDCLICSTFFRKILVEAGENPDALQLNDKETLVVEFGRQIAKDANNVGADLFARLKKEFSEKEIVLLTTFGAVMIATNIFNNALQVTLDDYLEPYRGIKPKK